MSTAATFVASAERGETSMEIVVALLEIAGYNLDLAAAYWADPSDTIITNVYEIVTKNGLIDGGGFFWGAAGNTWYNQERQLCGQ